jgi:predicted SprT family Zn-dependent metalloprotease
MTDRQQIAADWAARGFSCDLWTDPPGQRWENFTHATDELVTVLEGDMEFEVEGQVHHPQPGEESEMISRRRHPSDSPVEIPADLMALIARWAKRWRTPGLPKRLAIEYSPRLRTSLARSLPSRHLIRLNPVLQQPQNVPLLSEVLCHEAAHVAVFELHGSQCRPHGPEWSRLVTMAGFTPTLHLVVSADPQGADTPTSPAFRYEHRCPVCQMVRFARRPVSGWRCADCVAAGLDGHLVITRRQSGRGGRK